MFARKTFLLVIEKFSQALLGLITTYFIAHKMGAEVMGILAYSGAYVGLFFIFSNLGFDGAHLKRLTEGKDRGKCIGTYATIKLTISVMLFFVVILSIFIYKSFFGFSFDNDEQEYVIYIVLISIFLAEITLISKKTLEAERKIAKLTIPVILSKFLRFALVLIVIFVPLGIYELASIDVIISFLLFLIFFYQIRNYPFNRPDLDYFRSYLSYALPLVAISILGLLTIQLDFIMIAYYTSTESLGMFSAVHRISLLFAIIPGAAATVLFPLISELDSRNKKTKIRAYVHLNEKYIGIFILPIMCLMIVLSSEIISLLLGKDFLLARNSMIILCLYVVVDSLRKPFALQISARGKVKIIAKWAIITILLNIALNFLLIPEYIGPYKAFNLGMEGAALATLLSTVVFSILCQYSSYIEYKILPNSKMFYQYVSVTISGFLIYFTKEKFFTISEVNLLSLLSLIILGFIGLFTFLFILYLFGEFGSKEINIISNAMNPNKMKNYIGKEIND